MLNNIDLEALVIALAKAEADHRRTFDNINRHYKEWAHDRRYRVYFGCAHNDSSGVWYIGDPDRDGQKVYVERRGNCWYARFAGRSDYEKRLASGFKFDELGNYCGRVFDGVYI